MKILYHIRYPDINAAERWIFEAWRDGYRELGCEIEMLTADQELEERLSTYKPDLFMSDISCLVLSRDLAALSDARARGTKVAIWVHWPLTQAVIKNSKILRDEDVADVYFGEREKDHEVFFKDTGKIYHCIPQAASPVSHVKGEYKEEYKCDILYIGTKLPHKRWFELNVIEKLKSDKKISVKVIGSGWGLFDFEKRILRRIFKFLRIDFLRKILEKSLVKINSCEERHYYASAKICLNFHEREPDGSRPHNIVNQRTFKIPACGGFQICDDVEEIGKYFDNDEIIKLPLNRDIWLSTIYSFLNDDVARERIRLNGMRRAEKDHMAQMRCKSILKIAGLDFQFDESESMQNV
jgi:spore maturation protein CgeB